MEEFILKNQDSLQGINFKKLMLITNKEFVDILKGYLILSDYKLLKSVRINTETGDVIKIHIEKSIGLYHILIYRTIDKKFMMMLCQNIILKLLDNEKVNVNICGTFKIISVENGLLAFQDQLKISGVPIYTPYCRRVLNGFVCNYLS